MITVRSARTPTRPDRIKIAGLGTTSRPFLSWLFNFERLPLLGPGTRCNLWSEIPRGCYRVHNDDSSYTFYGMDKSQRLLLEDYLNRFYAIYKVSGLKGLYAYTKEVAS